MTNEIQSFDEFTSYEQVRQLLDLHRFKAFVYEEMKAIKFPFYCVKLPVLMNDGRQREINRAARMQWLVERRVRPNLPIDPLRQRLMSSLHCWGYFFIDDPIVALEFALHFAE